MKMASLITLPTENILEIGSYLAEYRSQRHIVSLYSTCRRLRAILATSIHRRLGIAVDDPNLLEVVDFTKKNPYFARSLSAVRLTSTDLSSYPSESENDVESFLELKEDYEELYEVRRTCDCHSILQLRTDRSASIGFRGCTFSRRRTPLHTHPAHYLRQIGDLPLHGEKRETYVENGRPTLALEWEISPKDQAV